MGCHDERSGNSRRTTPPFQKRNRANRKNQFKMSATAMLDLKQQLSRLSDKERQEVTALLQRLKQQSPAWQKEMTRRMAEMDGE
jgi:hypothetical protein